MSLLPLLFLYFLSLLGAALPKSCVSTWTTTRCNKVPPKAWPQTEHLDLSNSSLDFTSLLTLLPDFTSLVLLNISGSRLPSPLPPFPPSHLAILDLSNTGLTSIPDNAFASLKHLISLNLSSNPLLHLTIHKNLYELIISKTHITDLTITSPSLHHLDISFNHFLNQFHFDTPHLVSLHASTTSLNSIHLSHFRFLQYIDLSSNSLTDNGLRCPGSVVYLNLRNNSLTRPPPPLNHVMYLDLSDNQIKFFPSNYFSRTSRLVSLNVSRNPLTSLHIGMNSRLEHLVASSCQLISFASHTPRLRVLDLSSNSLSSLRGTFNAVTHLNLSHNHFENMSLLSQFPSLDRADLRSNKISILENHRGQVNLLDNPWHCDCNKIPKVDLLCHTPQDSKGIFWKSACTSQVKIEPTRKDLWVGPAVTIATLLVLLCLLFAMRLRCDCSPPDPEIAEVPQPETTQTDSGLPSYQEALLLPKPEKRKSVHSQTDLDRSLSTNSV